MIKSGIDILEIYRVEKLLKHSTFLTKHFTYKENEYFFSKNLKIETIAANFAGKEAFAKALGTGFIGFSPIDIEILRDKNNKPFINCSDKLLYVKKDYYIDISLSHSKHYAVANVIFLKK